MMCGERMRGEVVVIDVLCGCVARLTCFPHWFVLFLLRPWHFNGGRMWSGDIYCCVVFAYETPFFVLVSLFVCLFFVNVDFTSC